MSFLYKCLSELHNTYQRDLTTEDLRLFVLATCPTKDIDVYNTLLTHVEGSRIDDQVVGDVLVSLHNKKLAYDLALIALDVNEGRSSVEKIFDTINQFEQKKQESELQPITTDLESLYQTTLHQHGLRWRLKTLNKMLGSLRKGDFGFLFARPESGKTTFLASEVSHFATQVSTPILWFCNEEAGDRVMVRCIQASLGLTQAELFSNMNVHQEKFLLNSGKNIYMYDSASIHKRQIEILCKEHKPSLILMDQIDAIKGFKADREDLRLGFIYRWARELAKEYCPVIAITQADASGEGKRWLNMDNVANAKTEKQAMADFIIGLGKTHDTALEYVRHIHICKNKLSGDEDTDPTLRHGRMDIGIKPEIARYEDIDF